VTIPPFPIPAELDFTPACLIHSRQEDSGRTRRSVVEVTDPAHNVKRPGARDEGLPERAGFPASGRASAGPW